MRTALLAFGLWGALAGCLQAAAVECDDGRLCPSAKQCDLVHHVCISPAQVDACTDLGDGSACTFSGQVGVCDAGVCEPGACGNGVIDPGEICDGDLGVTMGEHCTSDCKHVDACGNGVLEPGETCDDGNLNGADHCDACSVTTWTAVALLDGQLDATAAGLTPLGIAADTAGTVYIADTANCVVWRSDVDGNLTTVAGTGVCGDTGDGGPATSAALTPVAVALDGLGDLFIADQAAGRIRRVDLDGIISTVAGNHGNDGPADGVPAIVAPVPSPEGVAVDLAGNLYIAESDANIVQVVDPAGVIHTFAGTGPAGHDGDGGPALAATLSGPSGLAVDGFGNVFIADTNSNRIRRVDGLSGTITTVAGSDETDTIGDGGPATAASLQRPTAVAIDDTDNLYISDSGRHRLRRVDAAGTITTFAGTTTQIPFSGDGGPAVAAAVSNVNGLALDGAGSVYLADTDNHRIRRVDATSEIITTIAGGGAPSPVPDGGAAVSADIPLPSGIAVDGAGVLYISDDADGKGDKHGLVWRVDAAGVITRFAGAGDRVTGGDPSAAVNVAFGVPSAVTLDAAGAVYIADQGLDSSQVWRVDPSGTIHLVAGIGASGTSADGELATIARLDQPQGVAVDAAGNVYIADTENCSVRRVDVVTGRLATVAGAGTCIAPQGGGDGGPATAAFLARPRGLAIDSAGNLYIADAENGRVRRVDSTGTITTIAGGGSDGDGGPAISASISVDSVALDAHGNVYLADVASHRIRRVDPTGTIETIAGTGSFGTSGDGGPATSAAFSDDLHAIASDAAGNLYVADRSSHRVQKIDVAGRIRTVAGHVAPPGTGPTVHARLANVRALVVSPAFTFVANGAAGTVERVTETAVSVVAGRYIQDAGAPTADLARYRDQTFGATAGVAFDATAGVLYLTGSAPRSSGFPSVPAIDAIYAVTLVNPAAPDTWTIAGLAGGLPGFADGPAVAAQFRGPEGLFLDDAAHQLYVADTGNHVIRKINLSAGLDAATVSTVAGRPARRGFFGDGGPAASALLNEPRAVTVCGNGDLFIADTSNNRVRRIAAGATPTISTILGDGSISASGDGSPASTFPVDSPRGLACDSFGNVYVTSTTSVRLVTADDHGVTDGTGQALTIYGAEQTRSFPASVTSCLTGLAVVDETHVQVVDACTGMLVELRRAPSP